MDLHLQARKVVLLPVTPWARAGDVGVGGAGCSGVGLPHSQGFVQDLKEVANMRPLVSGSSKGRDRTSHGKKSSTMKRARPAGYGAREAGCTVESVRPTSGGLVTGQPRAGS